MSYDYYDPFAAMLPVTDPPSCSVWIDGVRFADGQLGEDDSEPVVLTGLKITWGRELSLEQPDPDTASFDVLDLLGGQTYLDKLHIGARCDVRTDATIYPDPTISMLPYGDFEDGIGYSYTLSPGIGLRTVGAEARTNRALNPRAVSTPTSGWVATRWGGPSGTAPYSYVTGLTGHPAGITTCRRKTWTKAPTSNGDTGFKIWASSGAPNVPWPATIGQAYVVSIWMRPTAGTPKSGNVAIYPLDAAGALTGSAINGPATPLPPNVWTRMSVTGVITAPLAVGFKVMADVDGSTNVWAVGDTLDATGLLIELGTAVDSYFDGDTPDAHGIDYSWSGAVNESASAATGNHRLQVLGSTGVNSGSVIFPPAPLSNDPSAWNNVPRSQPSQTWRGQGTLYMTSDLGTYVQTAALKPVAFRNPNGLDVVGLGYPFGQVTSATPGANVVGPTDFQPPADRWIGLAVDINPMGPRWSDPAAELSWDDLGSSPAWWNLGIVEIDDIKLLAPGEGVVLSGMVFSGLITDLDANYDLHKGGTVVSVIAQDWTADLGNRYIGAEPWAQDSLGNRFAGMVALAGQATTYKIDPGPAALSVSYRDVDNQPAYRLMAELATSAGGVLWSATNLVTGPYLWLEDIDTRLPLETLQKDPDGVIRIHLDTNTGAIEIDACLPLLEPVHWVQATNDDATRVVIQWKEQTLDDQPPYGPKPTDRETLQVDAAREAATGVRRVSVSTELALDTDATKLGTRLLNRLTTPGWRITGITFRLGPDEPLKPKELATMMAMLDGTKRLGLPLMLTNLPSWSPIAPGTSTIPLYVEGGEFTSIDGYWTIELNTSDGGLAGQSAAWQDIPNVAPAWLWQEFDPAISWAELSGVGAE